MITPDEMTSASLLAKVQHYENIIAKFVDAELSFKYKAFCNTMVTYGSDRPRKWRTAFHALQKSITRQEV